MWYILSLFLQNVTYALNKSKVMKALTVLVSMLTLVIYFRGTDGRTTPDFSVYQAEYYRNSDYFEKGYNLLTHIANNCGLTYIEFRTALAIFSVVIFGIAIIRLTPNPELAFMGYFIASYLVDVVQIRQFAMMAFLLLGLSLLHETNMLIRIVGVAFLIIAPQFHSLGWIFVLLAPLSYAPVLTQLKYVKRLSWVVVGLAVVLYVVPKGFLLSVTSKLMSILSSRQDISDNVMSVYSKGSGIKVIAFLVIISVASVLVATIMERAPVENMRNIQTLMFTVYAQLASVILTYMSVDYVRLSRMAIVLLVLMISNLGINKHRLLMWTIVISVSFLSIYLQIGIVYQTNGRMIPYLLHFIDPNIIR